MSRPHQAPSTRLYCILATEAPVAIVFRRGPSDWFHLLRWRLDKGVLEPGAWVRKKIFPERCDLSADGDLLLYYLAGGFEGKYRVFGGISRAPWLHALASWDELGTWGRGACFVTDSVSYTFGEKRVIQFATKNVTIQSTESARLVNELRRGWIDAENCPPRKAGDPWDVRAFILKKQSPTGHGLLRHVEFAGMPKATGDFRAPAFEIQIGTGAREHLRDVVWADWDRTGRLLTASRSGRLRIETLGPHGDRTLVEQHDLSDLRPNPLPAPEWAHSAHSLRPE